jgi:hypothetical protein
MENGPTTEVKGNLEVVLGETSDLPIQRVNIVMSTASVDQYL